MFDSKHKDACLKIIDFGTARKMPEYKLMNKRIGTVFFYILILYFQVYYMAPEV